MTLMLHAGAKPVDYDGLRALTTPEATSTHVPIPHFRVVDLVSHSLSYYGHEVAEAHFGVTEDGMRFFGVISLKSDWTGYTDTVGLQELARQELADRHRVRLAGLRLRQPRVLGRSRHQAEAHGER